MAGDVVRIADYNGNEKEFTVMVVACLPYRLSVRHSHIVTPPTLFYRPKSTVNCKKITKLCFLHLMFLTKEGLLQKLH